MNVDPFPLLVPVDCCRPLDEDGLTDEDAEATAALFKALGDPARVRIVNLLARNPDSVCVCELTPSARPLAADREPPPEEARASRASAP